MKHLLTLLCLLLVHTAALSQKSLAIDHLFGEKFRNNEKSTETIVTGDALKGSGLRVYRSLIITDSPETADEIASAVSSDGQNATSREIKYIDGKIYYAQFALAPKDNENRYIFYLNSHLKGGNSVMLVYMCGKASPDQIKKLLKQK